MTATLIRNYLTQDFSDEEKKSYFEYVNGDYNSTDWIPKASMRREPLLLKELKCSQEGCCEWVGIRETGICKCSNGHKCYDLVIATINNLGN